MCGSRSQPRAAYSAPLQRAIWLAKYPDLETALRRACGHGLTEDAAVATEMSEPPIWYQAVHFPRSHVAPVDHYRRAPRGNLAVLVQMGSGLAGFYTRTVAITASASQTGG